VGAEPDLRLGDCLDPVMGLASLDVQSVDHTITDPPYGAAVHTKGRRVKRGGFKEDRNGGRKVVVKAIEYPPLCRPKLHQVAAQIARVTRRWALVFCQAEHIAAWRSALILHGMRPMRVGCWWIDDAEPQMNGLQPGVGWLPFVVAYGRGQRLRWRGNALDKGGTGRTWARYKGSSRGHEGDLSAEKIRDGQKPLWLMRSILLDYTDPGELVLDPFAGGGTTLLAASVTGRRAIGWEVHAPTHAAALARITGQPRDGEPVLQLRLGL